MKPARLEALVAEYLDRRDAEPDLAPEDFAAAHAEHADELVAAIRSTLAVVDLLPIPALACPATIGPYRVVREVGRGGAGAVLEVESPERARLALKLLPPAALLGPKALERFRREVDALAGLDDASIVAVRGFGTHAGAPYLVMDLVEGEPLSNVCGAVGARRATEVVRDLARALEVAHARGILHRDLKPHNAILRPDGRVVLIDFGLAALEGEDSLTSTGAVLGTPRYMSPEQARGLACDVRSDVYALGAVLYELLVGRPAYPQESRARVLECVLAGQHARPRSVRPDVPAALDRVTMQAMAWEPDRRYPSAAALRSDLERFLAGEPVRARPPGRIARIARGVREDPLRAARLGALALAALGGLAWGFETWSAGRAERLERVEAGRDRALAAWALGNSARARRELAEVERIAPADGGGRSLRALIDGGGPDPARDPPASGTPGSDAVDAIVEYRARRARGDAAEACRMLLGRVGASPGSAALHAEASAALGELGRTDEALAACARAIEIDPELPELWERSALLRLARGETALGVDEAHSAAELAAAQGDGSPTRLLSILRRASDPAAVRQELATRLAAGAGSVAMRFALAASYDTDHRLREARREYERVLADDPGHATAALYLANLRLGADLGRCRGCDESYAAAPEVLDREAGTELLVRSLDLDRGRDEGLLRAGTAIAIVHEVLDPVARSIEAALEGSPPDSVGVRLAAALDRLRQAGAAR